MKKILAGLVGLVAFVPNLTLAADTGACSDLTTTGFAGLVGCITAFMNSIVVLLIAGAVLFTVWGAFQMIRSEEKRESGRNTVIYGVIGIFVMVSIWGFVNILDSTFNLKGTYIAPPALTSGK